MASNTPHSSLSPSMTFGGSAVPAQTVAPAGTPSSTTGDSGSSGSAADSTDYFIGFIVTFVVLLLLFVSCGLGSRRRSVLLRPLWARNLEADHDGADHDALGGGGLFFGGDRAGRGQGKPIQPTRPVFWETWLPPRPDERVSSQWKDLQPISATFVRPTPSIGSNDPSKISLPTSLPLSATANSRSIASPQPHSSIFNQMRSWIASRRSCPHPPEPSPQPNLPPPNAIKIAVMVSMPSPFTTSQQYVQGKGEGSSSLIYPTLGESISGGYEIGLIQLPWTSGEVK